MEISNRIVREYLETRGLEVQGFLEKQGVLTLQTAARMGGLRFKNGAPGYDKAGIVEKLLAGGSAIRESTLATLIRLGGNGETPSKALPIPSDDWSDDAPVPWSQETPQAPSSSESQAKPSSIPERTKTSDAALRSIGRLEERLSRVESTYITAPQALRSAQQAILPFQETTNKGLTSLSARIEKLEERRPVELHIPELPTIKLDGTEHKSFQELLLVLHVNRRVILQGPSGTGKSIAAKMAAEKLGVPFLVQTPVTMSHELIGHMVPQLTGDPVFHTSALFEAYTKGGLCLCDEFDACAPDAMLVANPVFDGNGFAMFGDGKLHKQHPNFFVIMNMNSEGHGATMENAGRNRLDGATLARFCHRIIWEIDNSIETQMAQGNAQWHAVVKAVRSLITQRGIVDVNATTRHTQSGARLLAAGLSRRRVLEGALKNGALAEVWSDVKCLPEVRSFLQGA